jgi:DNA-binding transcriptional MerR regulator
MKDKGIPDKMYFRIGETADILGVKPYVLRYWETEFPDIKPVKSQSNQRLYKRRDVELLMAIKHLLYDEKFTINGARLHLKDLMKAQSKTEAEAPDGELFSPAPKSQPEARAAQPVTGDVKKVLSKIKGELNWCLSEIRK